MGTDSERRETTDKAIKRINKFIAEHDYPVIVLFSAIYAQIRLSSLYADEIITPSDDWNKVAKKSFRKKFSKLIDLCDKNNKLALGEKEFLTALRKKRNDVAHNSGLWQEHIDIKNAQEIEKLGRDTINFLERTRNIQ